MADKTKRIKIVVDDSELERFAKLGRQVDKDFSQAFTNIQQTGKRSLSDVNNSLVTFDDKTQRAAQAQRKLSDAVKRVDGTVDASARAMDQNAQAVGRLTTAERQLIKASNQYTTAAQKAAKASKALANNTNPEKITQLENALERAAADAKRYEQQLRKVTRANAGIDGKSFKGLADGVTAARGGIGKLVGSLGGLSTLLGGIGLAVVVSELSQLGAEALRLSEIQAQAVAQVEQGLISTGNQAGLTLTELTAAASELQGVSLFGDEQILADVTAQFLTFSNVQDDVFLRGQQLALDLATRLNGDVKGAAIQLGKALEDPVKGVTALTRSGVSFTEAERELIKSMVEAGEVAQAQELILNSLEQQYGGSAAAARDAANGQQVLSNTWGDFLERIGSEFEPAVESATGGLARLIQSTNDRNASLKMLIELERNGAIETERANELRKQANDLLVNQGDVLQEVTAIQIEYEKTLEVQKLIPTIENEARLAIEARANAQIETTSSVIDGLDSMTTAEREFVLATLDAEIAASALADAQSKLAENTDSSKTAALQKQIVLLSSALSDAEREALALDPALREAASADRALLRVRDAVDDVTDGLAETAAQSAITQAALSNITSRAFSNQSNLIGNIDTIQTRLAALRAETENASTLEFNAEFTGLQADLEAAKNELRAARQNLISELAIEAADLDFAQQIELKLELGLITDLEAKAQLLENETNGLLIDIFSKPLNIGDRRITFGAILNNQNALAQFEQQLSVFTDQAQAIQAGEAFDVVSNLIVTGVIDDEDATELALDLFERIGSGELDDYAAELQLTANTDGLSEADAAVLAYIESIDMLPDEIETEFTTNADDTERDVDSLSDTIDDVPTRHKTTFDTNATDTERDVDALTDTIDGVPLRHETLFDVDTADALRDLDRFRRAVESEPIELTAIVTNTQNNTGGGNFPTAPGGTTFDDVFADGGVVIDNQPRRYLAHEAGAELAGFIPLGRGALTDQRAGEMLAAMQKRNLLPTALSEAMRPQASAGSVFLPMLTGQDSAPNPIIPPMPQVPAMQQTISNVSSSVMTDNSSTVTNAPNVTVNVVDRKTKRLGRDIGNQVVKRLFL